MNEWLENIKKEMVLKDRYKIQNYGTHGKSLSLNKEYLEDNNLRNKDIMEVWGVPGHPERRHAAVHWRGRWHRRTQGCLRCSQRHEGG